jgi:hypothetical protein
MSAQELQSNTNGTPTMLGQNFTADEAARLHRLRATRPAETTAYLEVGLDECRVEFARWLIKTGRLRDDR